MAIFEVGGTAITASQAELNKLDTVTSSAAELNILTGVTSTAAELNLLDGSAVGNTVASKAAVLDASKLLQTNANNGTAGTNCTAVEYGDGHNHTSVITLSSVAATIGDNAALAGGALIYTLPAGACIIQAAYINVGITLTTGTPTTDTPDVGLGTVIGSGANALLSAVGATSEDILTGTAAADVAGTATVSASTTAVSIASGAAHTVHFNYADTWADVDDTAATMSGTVILNWVFLE